MGTGYISSSRLHDCMRHISKNSLKGDFAEIGVWKGRTFKRLCWYAVLMKKHAHAFDSFCGLAEPGVHDDPCHGKGTCSSGGVKNFRTMISESGIEPLLFSCWSGWIPDCFELFEEHWLGEQKFSFVFLDVDHYLPTLLSLEWLMQTRRIVNNGILVLDDWFPERQTGASRAIREWLRSPKESFDLWCEENNQLFILMKEG